MPTYLEIEHGCRSPSTSSPTTFSSCAIEGGEKLGTLIIVHDDKRGGIDAPATSGLIREFLVT